MGTIARREPGGPWVVGDHLMGFPLSCEAPAWRYGAPSSCLASRGVRRMPSRRAVQRGLVKAMGYGYDCQAGAWRSHGGGWSWLPIVLSNHRMRQGDFNPCHHIALRQTGDGLAE